MTQPVPIFELTRGRVVESVHYGAVAVVDAHGVQLGSVGDPHTVAFLRSSAKPFQALPFVEHGGVEHYGFEERELALACASHEGSDEHVQVAAAMQKKVGIVEADLQCGLHMPGDAAAYRLLLEKRRAPTANRNNCSGKHTAMLAHAHMRGLPLKTYLELEHPIHQDILATLAEMCGVSRDSVEVGIDGCSAPTFAIPLRAAALGFARLCDPAGLTEQRQLACARITAAMTSHPEMISGNDEFDCRLMQVAKGRIVCKRGAEGFQAIGLLPGALGPNSPGVGIAFKVSDGDLLFRTIDIEPLNRVRPAVTLEILRQLGALSAAQLNELAAFGPELALRNHRGLLTGTSRPTFHLAA
jgi:L-asparaginase II